ncbi:M2 family metallopeptidase [Parasphingopyxis sp. CP4]|uniref:M2 family metallopeptidase n=1 Tax=Parasphingopyxis sp. CP4 TaxID=2724527 RepID=UPI0015A2596F|nr:M2 family metallopeptidase [Parasphingopyxis sp. CP4]QLC21580.1 M2 family metallopeptidase [Parasphingopyxis sp. CP4]
MKIFGKLGASVLAVGTVLAASPALADNHAGESVERTPEAAQAFVAEANQELLDLFDIAARAAWVNSTYLNTDTDRLNTYFGTQITEMLVRLANESARWAEVDGLDYGTSRQLDQMRSGIGMPAPTRDGAAAELNEIATALSTAYSTGRATMNGEEINGNEAEARMGSVRDPSLLAEMWTSWHNDAADMRDQYSRIVTIANEGATELGYDNVGDLWRSGYDMSPDEFAALTERLWNETRPLYEQLHCYVRAELNEEYGDEVQGETGPIRADLLGNMWAQEWGNIYDIVAPEGAGDVGYDLTALLEAADYTPEQIVRQGEGFFSSLGFDPLPETFWERSQITEPRDRNVVCHASAWNLDNVDDLRIKMCTRVNADDFVTVHHELGHNYYQRAYNQQPMIFRNSANDGFHEAIGDMIALSVTPEYLVQVGLLDEANVPGADRDTGLLLRQAMDKVAFLPFGLLIDRWRWGVFDGSITPDNYNAAWNEMRLRYQGITPPTERSEENFDPGAKYHVPNNVSYTRYFLARILQFQFYQAACEQAGWDGPLHRCSFYGNEEVGERLNAMLEMGSSRPWPEALEAFTGTREMSAEPLLAYFQPLQSWLEEQNEGRQCGW